MHSPRNPTAHSAFLHEGCGGPAAVAVGLRDHARTIASLRDHLAAAAGLRDHVALAATGLRDHAEAAAAIGSRQNCDCGHCGFTIAIPPLFMIVIPPLIASPLRNLCCRSRVGMVKFVGFERHASTFKTLNMIRNIQDQPFYNPSQITQMEVTT